MRINGRSLNMYRQNDEWYVSVVCGGVCVSSLATLTACHITTLHQMYVACTIHVPHRHIRVAIAYNHLLCVRVCVCVWCSMRNCTRLHLMSCTHSSGVYVYTEVKNENRTLEIWLGMGCWGSPTEVHINCCTIKFKPEPLQNKTVSERRKKNIWNVIINCNQSILHFPIKEKESIDRITVTPL